MTKVVPYCHDCKHLKVEIITQRTCKLNCVMRAERDKCCWTGKRYPCKFEPKDEDLDLISKEELDFAITFAFDGGLTENDFERAKQIFTKIKLLVAKQ